MIMKNAIKLKKRSRPIPIHVDILDRPYIASCVISGASEVPVLPEIPEHVQYLIIGAGTAAFAAYRAIRSKDPKAKVGAGTKNSHVYM